MQCDLRLRQTVKLSKCGLVMNCFECLEFELLSTAVYNPRPFRG